MFRHALPILLGCSSPFALHAQAADAPAFKAHGIPMVMDQGGRFMLCPAKADGKDFLSQLKAKVDYGFGHMILPPLVGQAGATENRQVVQVAPGATPEQILEGIVAKNYNAVPLTKSHKGQYYVETTINGKARWMCLDSGADGIILDNSIAAEDAIELTAGKNAVGADGSTKPVSHGVVKSLSVGPNSFEKASLTFTDLSNFSGLTLPDGTTHPSAGLLGLAYFRSLPIAMDFSQKRLLVARQNIKGGLAGIKAQLGDLTAPMIEDSKGRHYLVTETMGQKVLFLVDVGALSTVLYTKGAELLKLESRADQGTVNTLGQKKAPRRVTTITEMKFGGHQLNGNVESLVLPGDALEMVSDLPVVGLVGCTLFEALKSTVDFKADQVTFDPKRFLKAP